MRSEVLSMGRHRPLVDMEVYQDATQLCLMHVFNQEEAVHKSHKQPSLML